MITIKKTFQVADLYPLETIGPRERILFFDIETTGFSGAFASLYLIGCVYYEGGSFQLIQWFADTKDSEKEMLKAFFSFLSRFDILLHFNGDSFDIPFILKRCERYKLRYHFQDVASFDIYKKIKPLKKLLNLQNLKQKTIEDFLGLGRTDQFNGGQLIPVYEEFIARHDERLKHFLLLHNEEDLKGMPHILTILTYLDLMNDEFTYHSHKVTEAALPHLTLQARGNISIPVPFSGGTSFFTLAAEKNRLTLTIPLYQGTCKYFYPNFKDYYYLPLEDNAIHKSVAEYVDREHRIKATAKTCYTKQNGTFLYEPSPIFQPALKRDYKDKACYAAYHPQLFEDARKFNQYIRTLLDSLSF